VDTSKQVLPEVRTRRRWTIDEKRRITQESFVSKASVSRIAQRHALNANQLFQWRKKYREGRLGSRETVKLLPVAITDERLAEAEKVAGVKVFHAGTTKRDNAFFTAGGRVLGVTARAPELKTAVERVYEAVSKIGFEGAHYRKDIAARALKK
jgi:transposase-like protein